MNETFEEILKKFGKLTYTNQGVSMLPMLRPGRDAFTIEKKEGRCKENDVVLFKMGKRYVLHRIVQVFDDHYTLIGDNCFTYEADIKDENILGILVSFQRNGKTICVSDPCYKDYVKILRFFERPRVYIKKTTYNLKKIIKKQARR